MRAKPRTYSPHPSSQPDYTQRMTNCAHTPIPLDFMSETRFMTEKSFASATKQPQPLSVLTVCVGGQYRRAVSTRPTRPYRRLIASWSCYSGSMDSRSLSITCKHDLSFSLSGPNRLAKFSSVYILYRKTLLIYAHLCSSMLIYDYFVTICGFCRILIPSTQSQTLSGRQ